MRRVALSFLIIVGLLSASVAVAGASFEGGCAKGGFERFQVATYDAGEITVLLSEFANEYESINRAVQAGFVDSEDLAIQILKLDRNRNGYLCIKDVYAANGEHGNGFYFYVIGNDDTIPGNIPPHG
jgi:hypothetical protein